MLTLSTPVEKLVMVGPEYRTRLLILGISTIGDLLYHIPFRYENYSIVSTIDQLQPGETVSLKATIQKMDNVYTKGGTKIQKATLIDTTGTIDATWYNQPFIPKILTAGTDVFFAGHVSQFGKKLVLESPSYEVARVGVVPVHSGRIIPIYSETKGVSSKWLRSRIFTLLTKIPLSVQDELPDILRHRYDLIGLSEALFIVHFPKTMAQIEEGRRRLAFDELFSLQLQARLRKRKWENEKMTQPLFGKKHLTKITKIRENLPFELTSAQRKAVREILSDLSKKTAMNRLLIGDVGSGKTVVAALAMFSAHLSGYRSILLAPTEILAHQHYETLCQVLSPIKEKIALVTARTKNKTSAKSVIFVGTHAVLSESFKMKKIGLVVVDEQQRFGVRQRATLRLKGVNPHLLSMTATPIPRTIALSLFSDLNVSFIDEMPKGRIEVKTWIVPPQKRTSAYEWVKKKIEQSGRKEQVFVVCPFIEESETLTEVKAAKVEYERLKTEIFPEFPLALLHGGLNEKKRNDTISSFHKGKYSILVSTPIIEVGIDIPTATVMIIEAADRFGLSQLHQLRGRVGRGSQESYCLLFTDSTNEKTLRRLSYLTTVNNGPKLAELDMKERGSGEIFGLRQHGHLGLKIATLSDAGLFSDTFEAAQKVLSTDSELSGFPLLRKKLIEDTIQEIAPD